MYVQMLSKIQLKCLSTSEKYADLVFRFSFTDITLYIISYNIYEQYYL